MRKCAACKEEFRHEYQYRNDAAGIDLCQSCSFKISKHFIEGWVAWAQTNAKLARQSEQFLKYVAEHSWMRKEVI